MIDLSNNIFYKCLYWNNLISLDINYWENFKLHKNSIFIYDIRRETFDIDYVATFFKNVIEKYDIDANKIYIFVSDELHQEELLKVFKDNKNNINIFYDNIILYNTEIPNITNCHITKKFSAFSRFYKIDRLKLFCELSKNNLLKDFTYTFHNINPYENTIFSYDDVLQNINEQDEDSKNVIKKWIMGIPYSLENDDITKIDSKLISNELCKSGIHVIIETHFSRIQNNPIAWFTEKTFKTISHKKPFIMYSTYNSLKYLRKFGFKTFSPFINEEYDNIECGDMRRISIIAEIKRLSELSNGDFEKIIKECKNVTDYNLDVLLFKKKKEKWSYILDKLEIATI